MLRNLHEAAETTEEVADANAKTTNEEQLHGPVLRTQTPSHGVPPEVRVGVSPGDTGAAEIHFYKTNGKTGDNG